MTLTKISKKLIPIYIGLTLFYGVYLPVLGQMVIQV